MRKIQFDIKILEDAVKFASKELRVSEEVIEINVIDKKTMFGFVKSYSVEAVVNVDPAEMGFKVLSELFENMQLEVQIEMKQRNERELSYSINTTENPLLIGKNGKTLENIQFYVRNIVNLYSDEHLIVLVDIGGYKANRKKQLEILATKTAKEVARTRVEAKLYPMNAYERRIIHTKLSDWRDVSTISEGEGQGRHLVIKPKRR